MAKSRRWDMVFFDPNQIESYKAWREACRRFPAPHNRYFVEWCNYNNFESLHNQEEGFFSTSGLNGFNPVSVPTIAIVVGMSWFTDNKKTKHVRVFSDRVALVFKEYNKRETETWLGGPTMSDPSPCECVYPCLYLNIPGWVKERFIGVAMTDWVKSHPLDAASRRIFADWLRDQGDDEWADDQIKVAEFIESGYRVRPNESWK